MTAMTSRPTASHTAAVTFRVFDKPGYIAGLDGIRAISVLLVMIAHFGFARLVPGGLGVTVFFFLSGFLITNLLLVEFDGSGRIDVPAFYMRRFLRLSPELLGLVVVSGLVGLLYRPATMADVAAAMTYTTNYFALWSEASGREVRWGHLWSLAVEEHYYITFPAALAVMLRRNTSPTSILIALILSAILWRTYIVLNAAPFGFIQQSELAPYTYAASECRVDSIIWGSLTALFFQRCGALLADWPRTCLAAGVAGAGLLLVTLLIRDEAFRETLRYSLQGLALLGAFVGLFFSPFGAWIRQMVLEIGLLKIMGRLSYGAYLWHMEFAFAARHFFAAELENWPVWQRASFALIASAGTFLMASLSLRLARPIMALRHRFGSRAERSG